MRTINGIPASSGIAIGKIFVSGGTKHLANPGGNTDDTNEKENDLTELERFRNAVHRGEEELTRLKQHTIVTVGEGEAEIFEIHRMMLLDDDFAGRVTELIETDGLPAAKAVIQTGEELAVQFTSMTSDYMKARAADVRGVAKRLAELLTNEKPLSLGELITEPSVLVAEDLTPAQTITLDRSKILAIVTGQGSPSSHTAILARSMGIPAVVGVGNLADLTDGGECMVDGFTGQVVVEPDEATLGMFRRKAEDQQAADEAARRVRGVRLRRDNGAPLAVCANAAGLDDVTAALANDAEGIGLFRSEFLFMQTDRPPTEEEQFEVYRKVTAKMGTRECVIRTLDAGADKRISYLNGTDEPNPALGLRAVRLCLRHPELLFTQFRALYRAAAYGNLSAMIPMVVLPGEMEQIRELYHRAEESLKKEGIPCGKLRLGMMIETPSAAVTADLFAGLADFFSIGTNDLIQYTLAADRENGAVSYLSANLPESVRRMIRMTCQAAKRVGIPVGVCGELAGDRRYLEFLLDCGVTKLSVSPPEVLRVRAAAAEALNQMR